MIHVGVIRCGKIAQVRHLTEYADNEEAQIDGVYDLNAERAKEIAEKYGARSYSCLLYTSRCV